MKWYWNEELEQHMKAVLDDQELGYMVADPEKFLDASTGVDHLRNFVIFYHDGCQLHLTLKAEHKRGRWLRDKEAYSY